MRTQFSSMADARRTYASAPWWLVMIAGIAVFIVGLLLLISPGMTFIVLVQLLGIYWLVTGILSLVSICVDRRQWGWKLVAGILGILAGLVVIREPLWSALLVPTVLIIFLAIDTIVIGATQLIHAFSGGGFGLALLGILNIIFGIILLFNPLLGTLALPLLLGIFAVIGGALAAIRAFAARNQETLGQPRETQPAA